jgi:microcin C transport system substrate-binding protein
LVRLPWLVACLFYCLATWAPTLRAIEYQHGYSYMGDVALRPDFAHFRYVNPDAPKGGEIRFGEMGTWDNFNPTTTKGREAAGTEFWIYRNLLYDRLLERAEDEPTARYGRLAEGVAVAEDCSWIAFKLRDGAYWHDGVPITTEDLVFSFHHYQDTAAPDIRAPFSVFEDVEALNEREVRYWVKPAARCDPILPIRLGNVPVLPAHYWADRDITRTTVEPPLGSGPYRIADFQVGRYVVWERVDDYWGRDLPVNRGRYNFDRIKFDYFKDQSVIFEAIKGNVIDVREETGPRRFFEDYDFPAARKGFFKTELIQEGKPAGLWWPVFWNLRQPRFQDIRVREALWLLYDTRWLNEKTSYGYWGEGMSFFHNSVMAQRGLPSDDELELLEPWRDQIPERVFTQPFTTPPDIGGGWTRDKIRRALALLNEAGWEVKNGELVHSETGEPFEIEIICVSRGMAGHLYPFTRVLKRVGIRATTKAPETSNWLYRMRAGDFDGGTIWFLPDFTPTLLVSNSFSSAAAEQAFSYNWAHVKNPAIDDLIVKMYAAKTMREFVAATRAIDRILLWNFYFIPGMSKVNYARVYWDKFGRPEHGILQRVVHLDVWWWDEQKAARIAAGVTDAASSEDGG